jgi:hypothetical protein
MTSPLTEVFRYAPFYPELEYLFLAELGDPREPSHRYALICTLVPGQVGNFQRAGLHTVAAGMHEWSANCRAGRALRTVEAIRHIAAARAKLVVFAKFHGYALNQRLLPLMFEAADAAVQALRESKLAQLRRSAAARVVQAAFKTCITDPDHPACRRRLLREFEHETVAAVA